MATMTKQSVAIAEAQNCYLDSFETILPRAFHPSNPIIKNCFPDTALLREWWRKVLEEEINNKNCYPLVAVADNQVVGFVCLRRMGADSTEPLGGFWRKHEWTEDHGSAIFEPIVESLVHWEREVATSMWKEYLHLELIGVDDKYKNQGIGTRLVQQACEIAKELRCGLFTQSGGAKDFFSRPALGFETLERDEVAGYKAYLSIKR